MDVLKIFKEIEDIEVKKEYNLDKDEVIKDAIMYNIESELRRKLYKVYKRNGMDMFRYSNSLLDIFDYTFMGKKIEKRILFRKKGNKMIVKGFLKLVKE